MAAEAPVGNGLIVDIGLRLGQKGLEILTDTQLFRTGAGVIRTAAAPQIELVAGIVQAADVGDVIDESKFRFFTLAALTPTPLSCCASNTCRYAICSSPRGTSIARVAREGLIRRIVNTP